MLLNLPETQSIADGGERNGAENVRVTLKFQ